MQTNPIKSVRSLLMLLAGASFLVPQTFSRAGELQTPPAILEDLQDFRQMGRVLYIAAHPDDENTQLITYLARGRHYRTAYLSLTRGDGGQNVLGPEFGEELGAIRTQELLAARRLDGGQQFFTRAVDFGFSKDYRETLRIWDRQQVLADIVRVIREFRPDVLITRFSTHPGGTHGHHTASAVLALEAFKLAGDPKAFPDQLTTLTPWQPKRILWNGWNRSAEGPGSNVIQISISGEDPVLGESFAEIAARSRSMHKTQGFGNFSGFRGRGEPRPESFELLAGEPAQHDILDGIDTTWNRVPGGAEVGHQCNEIIAHFDTNNPSASVPALLKLHSLLAGLPKGVVLDEKRRQLAQILQACLGLAVETTIPSAEVVPGETMRLQESATVHSDIPVRWVAVHYPKTGAEESKPLDLRPGEITRREAAIELPSDTPLTQPYWLLEDHPIGMYRVRDPSLIGRPENPPTFPIEQVFEVGGQTFVVDDQPVQVVPEATPENRRLRLEVIPPVSLNFLSDVKLFTPGATRSVTVELTAGRPDLSGTLELDAPQGWQATPARQPFHLNAVGDKTQLEFSIVAPGQPETAEIGAHAQIGGKVFSTRRILISYPHIPRILLQPPARLKAIGLELAIRGQKVGYVPGAGDSVAESLQDMGYSVTQLTGKDLTEENLRQFDALVFGVRAFNVRTDLEPRLASVFAYVKDGGNVIVQYNRPNGLRAEPIAPYELHLSNDRVTDETAPVTFLDPENPALNVPNKITAADFDGWIQERGLYFPDRWDGHFVPLLACHDPGEAPLKGSLLVAHDGKGYYVYTGLAWFRQLPGGVPGAYRLFANLISLGKPAVRAAAGAPQ